MANFGSYITSELYESAVVRCNLQQENKPIYVKIEGQRRRSRIKCDELFILGVIDK